MTGLKEIAFPLVVFVFLVSLLLIPSGPALVWVTRAFIVFVTLCVVAVVAVVIATWLERR